MLYTNQTKIPLSMAVFLATDYYDYQPGAMSATSLLKPLRQLLLAERVPPAQRVVDIAELAKSRMGTAYHDAIEKAWKSNYVQAMKRLGYKDAIIDRIRINPEPGTLRPGDIPVYMEERMFREIDGQVISGKPDFIGNGRLEDYKSTSVYSWLHGRNDWKYRMQGSIYRWLDPKKITEEVMAIQFLFTDWQKSSAKADPQYPQNLTQHKEYPLFSLEETEEFIRTQVYRYQHFKNVPEASLPLCTNEDLWRKPTVWKFYGKPDAKRATKVFEDKAKAYSHCAKEGKGVGVVKEVPGEVAACLYCSGFDLCTQKDALIRSGELKLA